MKVIKYLLVFVAIVGLVSLASAMQNRTCKLVNDTSVLDEAKEILENCSIVKTGNGCYHIVYDGRCAGILWENVSLDELCFGTPYETQTGHIKVPLIYDGVCVGFVNVCS